MKITAQTKEWLFAVLTGFLAALAIAWVLTGWTGPSDREADTAAFGDVKLELSDEHPPLAALRFGDGKMWFMVDTGSEYSYIDAECIPDGAVRIGDGARVLSLATIDGETEAVAEAYRLVTDNGFSFRVYAMDLTSMTRTLFIASGKVVVGIIGNDFLLENRLSVDYDGASLSGTVPGGLTTDSIQTNDTAFSNQQELDPPDASDGGCLQRAA